MIQRIQSLYLFFAAVLSALLLTGTLMEMKDIFGNIYTMGAFNMTVTIEGKTQVQSLLPLAIIIAAVPLACLVSVFLFRNRHLQMKFTLASLLLALGSLFVASFYVIMLGKKIEMSYIWHIKTLFPLAEALLCWLAYRAIKKDEEKVRSMDRIR